MALIDKSEFVGLDGVAHLCTGGEAPWLRSHDAACQRFGALKSAGMAGREEMFVTAERARGRAARLLGVAPAEVAFLAHASEGLNQAVRSVEWRAGDNVVFADLEYPSLIYPAALLRECGVEPRVIRTREHYLAIDDLAARVDRRTRLVLVSQVSYLTGQRLDLARCAEIAHGVGARLAVDATHAAGVVPVPGALCDFVVSSCYKWLLATHGVGLFAYSARRVGELAPHTVGWHSVGHRGGSADPLAMPWRADASRLEAGNPSLLGLAVLDNALLRLEPLAPAVVERHAQELGGALIEGLRARGFTVTTPEAAAERAGNVCFLAADAAGLAARLAARGVLVWGGEGRIRVSPHVHCAAADITHFFDALDHVAAPQPHAASH
ncbi:MAG TPA: aminotransferase class V-fold PLP-dependent enzyme [Candidatus Nitrosotalea sp.]|nr:aminotransferase class V-fold PLP-dependent enzyme [Candidatus Nitrosotalea sp.]